MSEHALWIAYGISNIVALLLLWSAWKNPVLARILFSILFGWAAWANTRMALLNPEDYLGYAEYTWSGWYRDFITGFFAQHIQPMVLAIAAGQACIALGLLGAGRIFRMACAGGIVFLLAIAPLGVGSAFPFSLIAGAGLWLLFRQGSRALLWKMVGSRE